MTIDGLPNHIVLEAGEGVSGLAYLSAVALGYRRNGVLSSC